MSIDTMLEETVIVQKTKELCQALLDEPGISSARQRIDAFMADRKSREQYEDLVSKGQGLQEKQQNAIALTGEEIADFEQNREQLLANPVARGFIEAQEEIERVRQSVQKYVSKTLELGRIPGEEELSSGGCCGSGGHGHSHGGGGGCGCSH